MNVMRWANGPQTAAHALKCISDGDLITAEGVGSDWDWRSEVTVRDAMTLAHVAEGGTVHHFSECWEHSDTATSAQMFAATRDLIDGKAVCDDVDHAEAWSGTALEEWLDIMEQNYTITAKGWKHETTKTEPQGTLWVCTDCMLARENDETPENPDREPWRLEPDTDVTLGMLTSEHDTGCASRDGDECDSECDVRSFSWRACDACGSPLAGERHAYTYWS